MPSRIIAGPPASPNPTSEGGHSGNVAQLKPRRRWPKQACHESAARPNVVSLAAHRQAKVAAVNDAHQAQMMSVLRCLMRDVLNGEVTGLLIMKAHQQEPADLLVTGSYYDDHDAALSAAGRAGGLLIWGKPAD